MPKKKASSSKSPANKEKPAKKSAKKLEPPVKQLEDAIINQPLKVLTPEMAAKQVKQE